MRATSRDEGVLCASHAEAIAASADRSNGRIRARQARIGRPPARARASDRRYPLRMKDLGCYDAARSLEIRRHVFAGTDLTIPT
jgi:hypothetical protein